MNEAGETTLRLRAAVRALLLTDAGEVLLARFVFPSATVWALPGGGLDDGEQPLDGLRRELHEELGLGGVEIGPHVWTRRHVIPMYTGHDGQRDQIHLVRVGRFEPRPAIGWEAMRAEFVHELRWWTLDEIAAATDHTRFAPRRLGELLAPVIAGEIPAEPIDTGV